MAATLASVTTAGSIEGWTIDAHLGVVSTHVVTGTGVFSDVLAGFSDFFGGRSGAYQRQLASIYDEAVTALVRKAEAKGANWIVGLKVDIDEVSGKNMQMLMVTAIGTAVRATRQASVQPAGSAPVGTVATAGDMQIMRRRLALREALANGGLTFDDATWTFLVEQRVEEAAPAVLQWLGGQLETGTDPSTQTVAVERAGLFFRALPREQAIALLYGALATEAPARRAATRLIRELEMGDFAMALALLRGPDMALRRAVLQAITAEQSVYRAEDLATIDELLRIIPDAFPNLATYTESKGLLGTKRRWTCGVCGAHGNDPDVSTCLECQHNQFGFLSTSILPERALQSLRIQREALLALLNQARNATA